MPCLLRLLEPALCTLLFSLRYAHRVRTVHVANLRHILLLVSRLAAVFCAFACIAVVSRMFLVCSSHGRELTAVGAALAAFLADETTAQNCQAGSQASAILLLGCLLHGRRSLLVAHLNVASVYRSCVSRTPSILVVEGDNTVPEGGHIVLEEVRIPDPEEGRNSYNAVSGYTDERDVVVRDLRLLGLLGVVVGHVGCALGRSDCSQWSRVECR